MPADHQSSPWTRSGVQAGAALGAAAVLGLADITVALGRQPPLADAVRTTAAALGLGLCVLAAVPVALLLAGASQVVRRRPPSRRAWICLTLAGLVLAAIVVVLRVDLGEVDWHGVDPWTPGSLALAGAVYLGLAFLLTRLRRAAAALVVALAAAAGIAATATFTASAPQARGEALAAIDESSVISRGLAHVVARRLDADGDGHPRWLCGPSCDCDDGDAAVHPGAVEVPTNGVDEDCNPATPGGCSSQLASASVGAGSGGSGFPAADLGVYAAAAFLVVRRKRRPASRSRCAG